MEKNDNTADAMNGRSIREAHSMRRRHTGKRKFQFEIGRLAILESVLDKMDGTREQLIDKDKTKEGSFTRFVWSSFSRHCLCDWGDLFPEEKRGNDLALKVDGQLVSVYTHTTHPTIGILTEDDRTETVIGLLSDFIDEE